MEQSTKYNGWTNYETWAVMLEIVNDNMETYHEYIKGKGTDDAVDEIKETLYDTTVGVDRFTDEFLEKVNYEEVVESIDDWYNQNFCSWCGEAKYEKDHSKCSQKEKLFYLYD